MYISLVQCFINFGILRSPLTFCATFLVLIKSQKRRFAQISPFPLELGLTFWLKGGLGGLVKVADRPSMCYIFEKAMVQGPQKQCSQVSDVQTHKDKYTNTQIQNTQIQLRSKLQIGLACAIFLKRQWYKDLNNSVPKCLTCKHTKTNTEINK